MAHALRFIAAAALSDAVADADLFMGCVGGAGLLDVTFASTDIFFLYFHFCFFGSKRLQIAQHFGSSSTERHTMRRADSGRVRFLC